jgi:hypothetical protein
MPNVVNRPITLIVLTGPILGVSRATLPLSDYGKVADNPVKNLSTALCEAVGSRLKANSFCAHLRVACEIHVVQEPDLGWIGIFKPFLSVAWSSDGSPHAC